MINSKHKCGICYSLYTFAVLIGVCWWLTFGKPVLSITILIGTETSATCKQLNSKLKNWQLL